METLFNILSIFIMLVLGLGVVGVEKCERYISCPGWSKIKISLYLSLLSQCVSLANIYFFGGGLNWLGIVNTTTRLVVVGLFAWGVLQLAKMFKLLVIKLPVLPKVAEKVSKEVDKNMPI